MNYEAMSDFEINKAITGILLPDHLRPLSVEDSFNCRGNDNEVHFVNGSNAYYDYCNNPSDAWPIIVRNKINIE